ncbi:formimidoylglutamate deiminase [Brevundimonas sp.]|uniref:formimidoylglutamate deiminase n=1 Tax=Brevundimonas sp. TaxID=1871086 RepID=UPI0025C08F82|nr:formimidoylglutamate deiminase [Brevundimonas sp.]MCG2662624.1 formimidoylglutamate deiminase [Brevundimonas sp.]
MTVDAQNAASPETWLWFEQALLDTGWAQSVRIGLRNGLIDVILTGVVAEPGDQIHVTGVPGLSNLHSHAFQRGMAGLAEVRGPSRDSFWTWRETMYRFVDRLRPDEVAAIAAMAFAEMLEGGFTRVAEFHYLHHDLDGRPYDNVGEMAEAIAAAAAETGIALTLLPVFYAHSAFGGAAPAEPQRRFINGLDGFHSLMQASERAISILPDAIIGVAPHSLRAVTREELSVVCGMTCGPVHIHIAEQVREVDDCLVWSGARPVDLLFDTVEVDRRWCLVHATHMSASETRRLANSGAVAGLCPMTEANLGDGIFPAAAYLAAGGVWGVGSDSNVLIDAAQELRMLEYSQRLAERSRNVMAGPAGGSTGGALFRAALAGGARAAGVSAGLVVGEVADIVALAGDGGAAEASVGDPCLDRWIFAARDRPVEAVWRRGGQVVRNGRHVAHAETTRRFARVLAMILDLGNS